MSSALSYIFLNAQGSYMRLLDTACMTSSDQQSMADYILILYDEHASHTL